MKLIKQIILCSILLSGACVITAPILSVQAADTVNLENPIQLKDTKNKPIKDADVTPALIIGTIIKSFLGLVGGLSLVMMVFGGFQWLTSAGNEEKVKKGSQTMMWSIIGLVIVLSSYLLVNTVLQFLKGSKG